MSLSPLFSLSNFAPGEASVPLPSSFRFAAASPSAGRHPLLFGGRVCDPVPAAVSRCVRACVRAHLLSTPPLFRCACAARASEEVGLLTIYNIPSFSPRSELISLSLSSSSSTVVNMLLAWSARAPAAGGRAGGLDACMGGLLAAAHHVRARTQASQPWGRAGGRRKGRSAPARRASRHYCWR